MTDPLRTRYASPEMAEIWGLEHQIQTEHQMWLGILGLQIRAGLADEADWDAYNEVATRFKGPVGGYRERYIADVADEERETGHDLVARLRVFDRKAGGRGKIHLGLTSSDITENAHQWLMLESAMLLGQRATLVLDRLATLAGAYATVPVVARTHLQPAQATTLGKRFAGWGEELLQAAIDLQDQVGSYRMRGLKGAVGTAADYLALVGPEDDDSDMLLHEASYVLAGRWGSLIATGQNYPKSHDIPLAAAALRLVAAPAQAALAVRLMAGLGQAQEGAAANRVGSSAMPHKRNPVQSERICGLQVVARHYAAMATDTAGSTWLEGDIADSSVRRVAWPGLFLAADAVLLEADRLLGGLRLDLLAIAHEVRRYLFPMATGRLLAAAAQAGANREQAHEALRVFTAAHNPDASLDELAGLLAQDPDLGLTAEQIAGTVARVDTGAAVEQTDRVVRRIRTYTKRWRDDE